LLVSAADRNQSGIISVLDIGLLLRDFALTRLEN